MFEAFYPFDLALGRAANALLKGAGVFFTPVFKVITYMGEGGAAFIALTILFLLFKKTRKAGVCAAIALAIGVLFTNIILKNAVARPRPYMDETTPLYEFWQAAGKLTESGYSFPSGHTTAAAAFAVPLFLCMNKKTSWLYLLIPLVMGFTRIYFFVHFASDVLFGLIIGSCGGVAAYFIYKLLMRFSWAQKGMELPGIVDLISRWRKKPATEPAEESSEEDSEEDSEE